MLTAGVLFALSNVLTQYVASHFHIASVRLAFWQYLLSLIFFVPLILQLGLKAFRTHRAGKHILRVVLATLGVQFFISALTHGVDIWQVVATDMTSPFMVIIGARIFLNEQVGWRRWIAVTVGFIGGMIILAPWSTHFTVYSLLPFGSAAMWAAYSLMTKAFVADEAPETVTIYLLVLLTPINAVFLAAANGFAPGAFIPPHGMLLGGLLALGALTAGAQTLLTRAYASADASFLQPFDNVRLPLNILAGFMAFGSAPSGWLWCGALLIIGASFSLIWAERTSSSVPLSADI